MEDERLLAGTMQSKMNRRPQSQQRKRDGSLIVGVFSTGVWSDSTPCAEVGASDRAGAGDRVESDAAERTSDRSGHDKCDRFGRTVLRGVPRTRVARRNATWIGVGPVAVCQRREGIRRVLNGGLGEKGMPAFGGALKPERVNALMRYIRENQTSEPEPPPPTRRPSEEWARGRLEFCRSSRLTRRVCAPVMMLAIHCAGRHVPKSTWV